MRLFCFEACLRQRGLARAPLRPACASHKNIDKISLSPHAKRVAHRRDVPRESARPKARSRSLGRIADPFQHASRALRAPNRNVVPTFVGPIRTALQPRASTHCPAAWLSARARARVKESRRSSRSLNGMSPSSTGQLWGELSRFHGNVEDAVSIPRARWTDAERAARTARAVPAAGASPR